MPLMSRTLGMHNFLGGSWVVISRVISRITIDYSSYIGRDL